MIAAALREREAAPVACDVACILCSDAATRGDLCDACHGAHEFASEHPVRCACGACLVHAKIEARRAAVRS